MKILRLLAIIVLCSQLQGCLFFMLPIPNLSGKPVRTIHDPAQPPSVPPAAP